MISTEPPTTANTTVPTTGPTTAGTASGASAAPEATTSVPAGGDGATPSADPSGSRKLFQCDVTGERGGGGGRCSGGPFRPGVRLTGSKNKLKYC